MSKGKTPKSSQATPDTHTAKLWAAVGVTARVLLIGFVWVIEWMLEFMKAIIIFLFVGNLQASPIIFGFVSGC